MPNHNFVKCEAVKVSYRQNKDGMVVSFAIHPSDLPPELALAPVGTRVLLAVAEIVEGKAEPEPEFVPHPVPIIPPRPKDPAKSARARETYAMQGEPERAVTRSAMRVKNPAFQKFLGCETEEDADRLLKGRLGIKSKREIATNPRVFGDFIALEGSFEVETQYGEHLR
jgi:hypothetical protein